LQHICAVTTKFCKFSKSPGCIRKIPLNPPLQKGEAVGMPGLIEMLPNFNRILQNSCKPKYGVTLL
jgi:hypothetical protein